MGFIIVDIVERICIAHAPIDTNQVEIFNVIQEDKNLVEAIINFGNELEDVEIFDQNGSMIATEQGYYLAFYEKQLTHEK